MTVVAFSGIAACSSSSSNGSNGSSGGGDDTCGPVVACHYLAASDVNGVLDTNLPAGVENDLSLASSDPTQYVCDFSSSDHQTQASFNVICNPMLVNSPANWQGAGFGPSRAISELGEGAFWLTEPDGGGGLVAVIIFYGKHSTLGVSVMMPPGSKVDASTGAIAIAKMLEKKLGI